MSRTSSPRLGAYGLTALLALFALPATPRTAVTATAVARRMTPPAPPPTTPIAEPAGQEATRLINEARARAGLPALVEDARLDTSAARHAADQAAHLGMSHTGSNGSNPGQRMTAAGFVWQTWGENVAAGQATTAEVVAAWLASAPHRANILNPAFTSVGAASAPSADGTLYWTMDLAA